MIIDLQYKMQIGGNWEQVEKSTAKTNTNLTNATVAATNLGKAAGKALNQANAGVAGGGPSAAGAGGKKPPTSKDDYVDYRTGRGAAGRTGAAARDFAEQATTSGLGPLVKLYATLAGNIFAAVSAFELFKRAFQFDQLQRASEAFAATTGRNLAGISKELEILSGGALTTKAAQAMANYGASAGFTTDQLKRIIGAARGASQALGRDFGDSVDRLIRGIGKLEPELLDELGLLTRTKVASEAYAKSVGKTFEELTQFEKVQAFANAVLTEAETKFGAVSKAVDVSVFEKFSAALTNAATSLGRLLFLC